MIATERLLLLEWTDADRTSLHAMCTGPRVMAFIGPVQSRAESDAGVDRRRAMGADFDDPAAIPALRRHRTYRIARP